MDSSASTTKTESKPSSNFSWGWSDLGLGFLLLAALWAIHTLTFERPAIRHVTPAVIQEKIDRGVEKASAAGLAPPCGTPRLQWEAENPFRQPPLSNWQTCVIIWHADNYLNQPKWYTDAYVLHEIAHLATPRHHHDQTFRDAWNMLLSGTGTTTRYAGPADSGVTTTPSTYPTLIHGSEAL